MNPEKFVLPATPAGEELARGVETAHVAAGFTVVTTREDYGSTKFPAHVVVVTCTNTKPTRKERGCYI